ncbi:MAG: mechanosensitive ion channel, partial [Chloroflexaceae bacterium]|nr:mechanosensitive ion channel [Chloroflexaceae bacterium]
MGIAGIFLIGRIWFGGFDELATFLGLISAGLAIALRDLLIDIAAWMFIVWRKPFKVGDRVQVGDVAGDVIDIRLFQFTLLEIGNWVDADQSTGRVVHVPNGRVFAEPQANYTEGFDYIWNEIPVTITFESNWKKAKEILLRIAMEHTRDTCEMARQQVEMAANDYYIVYSKLTPTVYTHVKDDHGIILTIRYLSIPRRRRSTAQELWEAILTEFAIRMILALRTRLTAGTRAHSKGRLAH